MEQGAFHVGDAAVLLDHFVVGGAHGGRRFRVLDGTDAWHGVLLLQGDLRGALRSPPVAGRGPITSALYNPGGRRVEVAREPGRASAGPAMGPVAELPETVL